jgi:signal transduction histidine kinase
LELRYDGDGFSVKNQHDGLGLAGMRERAEQMGGTLKVASARGKGTTIVVTVPYSHESRPTRNNGLRAVGTVRA